MPGAWQTGTHGFKTWPAHGIVLCVLISRSPRRCEPGLFLALFLAPTSVFLVAIIHPRQHGFAQVGKRLRFATSSELGAQNRRMAGRGHSFLRLRRLCGWYALLTSLSSARLFYSPALLKTAISMQYMGQFSASTLTKANLVQTWVQVTKPTLLPFGARKVACLLANRSLTEFSIDSIAL